MNVKIIELLDLLDEAQAAALPVRIHVEQFNPAMRLYLRLGFEPIEESESRWPGNPSLQMIKRL